MDIAPLDKDSFVAGVWTGIAGLMAVFATLFTAQFYLS